MKLTFVFIAVCFAFVAIHSQDPTTDEEDDDAAFIKYLKQYNKKNYTNLIEYLKRKLEFKKCFTRISKHNKNYDKGLVSFMLRENKFCDLFDSERQKLANGNRLPAYDFTDFQMNTKTVGTVSNTTYPPGPPSISWRAKKCVTPVKDQGYYCNCCWAFSAIASLESHWCIKTGQLIRMSEQQAIDCNRNEQTGNWGCDGGSPAAFYMYVYGNDGIQNDTTYPFQEDVEHSGSYACRYNGVNRIATTCGYWRVQRDEEVMKNVIAGKGPVSAAVCASLDSFCKRTSMKIR